MYKRQAYTCGDLFYQSSPLLKAREELARIISATKDRDILVFVGLPWEREDKLFNCLLYTSRCV